MKINDDELMEEYLEFMDRYMDIKQQIRNRDKHLYERWKAGGFIVDDDIISMYPSLSQAINTLLGGDDDETY